MKSWKKAIAPLLVLAFAALVGHRVWRSPGSDAATMEHAAALSDEAERELYLVPAGRYTQADIKSNGPLLPSVRYRAFQATHDFSPQSGDVLCPISRTKANAACTWIVNGVEYQFCCPPCIDEFVRMAKEQPDRVELPSAYVQP